MIFAARTITDLLRTQTLEAPVTLSNAAHCTLRRTSDGIVEFLVDDHVVVRIASCDVLNYIDGALAQSSIDAGASAPIDGRRF